jgi:hypothetical protein
MYTGIVKRRAFTLVLTLVVAATPVVGVICEIDCDAPRGTQQTCHEPAGAREVVSLRNSGHECRRQHDPTEATVANASAGNLGTSSIAAFLPIGPSVVATDQSRPACVHGPPGSSARTVTSLNTILRI